tara:strand:+ start:1366 stop:1650 length:285 start_codon:yes stop_codon:yes gene_type:complete
MKKLIRDKVAIDYPDWDYKSADDEEFFNLLIDKMSEELLEFKKTPTKEELADMLEIIHQLAHIQNISLEDLESERKKKETSKGNFSKRLIWETK